MMIGPFCILLNANEVEFRSARPSPQAGCEYRVVEIYHGPARPRTTSRPEALAGTVPATAKAPAENLLIAHALPL
jgi:hypothetical protein